MSIGDTVTNAGAALSLSPNWTTAPVTLTNAGNAAALSSCANGWCANGYWYPYYTPIYSGPWIEYRDHRPIRLTMAEIEGLRVAAKKDKALRETLEKFTDHIEVVVDFK